MAYSPSRKLWLLSCMRALQALTSTLLLLSCMVIAHEAEPPPRGYRFELTHVDANRGFSNNDLMRRAINRSRLRAATLYSTHAMHSAASNSPILSPAHLNKGAAEYFMTFYMGEPPQMHGPISAVADTGSNLIWTVEKECHKSKTISTLPCSSDMCQNHANCECNKSMKMCEYSIKYGGSDEGTKTGGFLYEDMLTFPMMAPSLRDVATDWETVPNVAIGCSIEPHSEDKSISGVVGLGRGAQSLPGQLNSNQFSYCLNTYSNPERPSTLLLRTVPNLEIGAKRGATIATTGLRRNEKDKTWYFVDLQGISISDTRLDITLQSSGTGGNMFVDSGTSYTLLEENAFNKVLEKVNQIMGDKKLQTEDDRICYPSPAHPDESLPKMTLHFADSADMVLPWDSYFWHDPKASTLCLTILKSQAGMPSVLGNYQQQGIHMLFDTDNEKLSFVPADDCSLI